MPIQNIPTFNGSDPTQLEDWLVNIETAANPTHESRTKLAWVKLKGLTCTLITEALTSDKCWEEIKDLIHLKLQFGYSYISKSLHGNPTEGHGVSSKREAKRYNLTNNAAMIRILVGGLKNTHTLTSHVYEEGPQTLVDAINEV